jgi:hypothetical protein
MRRIVIFFILSVWLLLGMLFFPLSTATSKPSVPEFTLRYVDNSYFSSQITISTTDPYTGQVTTSTAPGYYVENKSVHIIITNQPFTIYKDENGSEINLYYDVAFKGHYEKTWRGIKTNPNSYCLYDRDSSTTTIPAPLYNISAGGQVDVKVRALIGKFVTLSDKSVPPFMGDWESSHLEFVGEASEWSSTLTINIGDGSAVTAQPIPSQIVSPTTNLDTESPAATPLQPSTQDDIMFGLGLWQVAVIALSVVVVLLVFVVFYLRRRSVGRQSV